MNPLARFYRRWCVFFAALAVVLSVAPPSLLNWCGGGLAGGFLIAFAMDCLRRKEVAS